MSGRRHLSGGLRHDQVTDDGSPGSDEGSSRVNELNDYLFSPSLGWGESVGSACAVGTAISMGVGTAGASSRAGAAGVGTHQAVGAAYANSDCGARGLRLGLSVGAAGAVSSSGGSGQSTAFGVGSAHGTSSAEGGSLVVLPAVAVNSRRARELEGALQLIERYMADAVAACYADGIKEPGLVRDRIRQAQRRAKERLCQRSSSD